MTVTAGPDGADKTCAAKKLMHHEWAGGMMHINPDNVTNNILGDRTRYFTPLPTAFTLTIIPQTDKTRHCNSGWQTAG